MSDMDRFRYYVTPYSPITDLIAGQSLRRPFTVDLDREEVFKCMKHGPVYRKFPTGKPIKVTGENFESLHKTALGDDSETKPSNDTKNIVEETVENTEVAEDTTTDVSTESIDVESTDEQTSEEVVDENTNDSEVVEDTEDDNSIEDALSEMNDNTDVDEEKSEEVVEASNPQQHNNNNHNQYHTNKKRRH